jgi:hypothetical protein
MLIRAFICPFWSPKPTYHPAGGVEVLQKAWDLPSDDVKYILNIAELT